MRNYLIVGLFTALLSVMYYGKYQSDVIDGLNSSIVASEMKYESLSAAYEESKKSYEAQLRILEETFINQIEVDKKFTNIETKIQYVDSGRCSNTNIEESDDSELIHESLKLMEEAACIANSCLK